MKPQGDRIRLITFLASLAAVAWLVTLPPVQARSASTLTPQEKRGKQIYLKGESEGGEIIAILGSGDLELPASSFSCSNCHGLKGEGGNEGGLQPPPITWSTLAAKHTSALTEIGRAHV